MLSIQQSLILVGLVAVSSAIVRPPDLVAQEKAQGPIPRISYSVQRSEFNGVARHERTIGNDPRCEFDKIVGVVIDRGGRVIVANSGGSRLCWFDQAGRFIRHSGRRGSGPGEYNALAGLHLFPNDTLLAYDDGLRRFTVVDSAGRVARTFAVAPPAGLGALVRIAAMRRGALVLGFSEFIRGTPQPDPVYFSLKLSQHDNTGEYLRSLGRFFYGEHMIVAVPQRWGGVGYFDRAFGLNLSVAPVTSGFVAGDGANAHLIQYDLTGDTVAIHVVPGNRQRVMPDHRSIFSRRVVSSARPQLRELVSLSVERMAFPSHFPLFQRIVTDANDNIWVQLYALPDSKSTHFMRLDPATGHASPIAIPRVIDHVVVRNGMLCGVAKDEYDLETIECFRIGVM